MSRSEKPKPLPDDIRLAIERLKKAHSCVTYNISPAVLSRLPANVLRTVLKLRKESEKMGIRITAAEKIKNAHPGKKSLVRIDDILEIHPEEMKELIYRMCEPEDEVAGE